MSGTNKDGFLKPRPKVAGKVAKANGTPKKVAKIIPNLIRPKAKANIVHEEEEQENLLEADEESSRAPLDRLRNVVRDTRPAWMKKKMDEENAEEADEQMDAESEDKEDDTAKKPRIVRQMQAVPKIKPLSPPEASSSSSSSLATAKPTSKPPSTPPQALLLSTPKAAPKPSGIAPAAKPPSSALDSGFSNGLTGGEAITPVTKTLGNVVATSKPSGYVKNDAPTRHKEVGEAIGASKSKSVAVVPAKIPPPPQDNAKGKSAAVVKAHSKAVEIAEVAMSKSAAFRASLPAATPPSGQNSQVGASELVNSGAAPKWDSWDSWDDSTSYSEQTSWGDTAASDNTNIQTQELSASLRREQELTASLRSELEGMLQRNRSLESSASSQKSVVDHNWTLEKRCQDLQQEVAQSNMSSRRFHNDCQELRAQLTAHSEEAQRQQDLLKGELNAGFTDRMSLQRKCEEFESTISQTSDSQSRCEQLQLELTAASAKAADSLQWQNLQQADKEGLEKSWRAEMQKASEAVRLAEHLKMKESHALEAYHSEVSSARYHETRSTSLIEIASKQTEEKMLEKESAEKVKKALATSEERVSNEEQAARSLQRELKEAEERYRSLETKAKAEATLTNSSLHEELMEKTKIEKVLQSKIEKHETYAQKSLNAESKLQRDLQNLRVKLEGAQEEVKQQQRDMQALSTGESELETQRRSFAKKLSRFEEEEKRRRLEEEDKRRREDDSMQQQQREYLEKKIKGMQDDWGRQQKDRDEMTAEMRQQLEKQLVRYQVKLEASTENYAKARQENTDLRGSKAQVQALVKYYENAEESLAHKLGVYESQESSGTQVLRIESLSSQQDQGELLHRVAVATGNVSALEKENEILERKHAIAVRQRQEALKKVHVLRNAFKLHRAQTEFDAQDQERLEVRIAELEDRAEAAEQTVSQFRYGAMQQVAFWNELLNGDTEDIDVKNEDDDGERVKSKRRESRRDDKVKKSKEQKSEEEREDPEDDDLEEDVKKQESDVDSENTELEEDSPKSSPRDARSDDDEGAEEASDEEQIMRSIKEISCGPEVDESEPAIACEGEGMAILYKPPGWTCTTSSSKRTYGMQRIQDWIVRILGPKHEYLRNCKDQIYGLAHRLDCDTSGPLILATKKHTMTLLKKSMHSGHWYKEYLALMHGKIPESRWAGRISAKLTSKFRPGQGQFTKVADRGKPAVTHYQAVQFYRRRVGSKVLEYTLVRCRIVTGRTHQIRVHLAHLGERLGLKPRGLVGDSKYAFPYSTLRDDNILCNRIFLHENVLQLPALGKETLGAEMNRPLKIESPLPDDLRRALGKLELDSEGNDQVAQFREFLRRSSTRAVPETKSDDSERVRLVAAR